MNQVDRFSDIVCFQPNLKPSWKQKSVGTSENATDLQDNHMFSYAQIYFHASQDALQQKKHLRIVSL